MNALSGKENGRPGSARRSLRVLVVDANIDQVAATRLLLDTHGMETAGVTRPESAMLEIEAFRPDAVLLDIGMPEVTGFDIVKAIRSSLQHDTFVIAVTAFGSELDRHRSKLAGFDRHLTKPVDPGELLGLLQRHALQRGIAVEASVTRIADARGKSLPSGRTD